MRAGPDEPDAQGSGGLVAGQGTQEHVLLERRSTTDRPRKPEALEAYPGAAEPTETKIRLKDAVPSGAFGNQPAATAEAD